jgi:branched-chain amino acid transport system substrate-binding protein
VIRFVLGCSSNAGADGPASAYGAIGKSSAAYFAKINDQGGINGRKIEFISRDDSYNPSKTVELARKLVEQDQVYCCLKRWGRRCNWRSSTAPTGDY